MRKRCTCKGMTETMKNETIKVKRVKDQLNPCWEIAGSHLCGASLFRAGFVQLGGDEASMAPG